MLETSRSADLLIIGGGITSLYLANTLTFTGVRKITIIEKDDSLGKRILVSGNGRCNIYNQKMFEKETIDMLKPLEEKLTSSIYDRSNAVFSSFDGFDIFCYHEADGLYYPFYNRAECVRNPLLRRIENGEIEVIKGKALKVNPTQKNVIVDVDGTQVSVSYSNLVVATGGRSYDRANFDYSLLESLEIPFVRFSPSLCPVKAKEKIPSSLVKQKVKGILTLLQDEEEVFCEEGEVLFKEDGLSGIVVFNMTSVLNGLLRKNKDCKYTIKFNYNEHDNEEEYFSIGCLPVFLREGIKELGVEYGEPMVFTFDSLYPFENSQVSSGGVVLENLRKSLVHPKYDDIQFMGEIIDLDLPCGGFNIGTGLIEAYEIFASLGGEVWKRG